jgi:cystathionine gamma-synthase
VESLISHPASMTHAGMEESARLRAGIGAGLLRVSVGIEDTKDLVADLSAGLERAVKAQQEPHLRRHAS